MKSNRSQTHLFKSKQAENLSKKTQKRTGGSRLVGKIPETKLRSTQIQPNPWPPTRWNVYIHTHSLHLPQCCCVAIGFFLFFFFVLLPFFLAFIGLSCLCWQVVFVCRVIESIVSGSSMRQSSESVLYGVFPFFIFPFLLVEKSFVFRVEAGVFWCWYGQHPFRILLPGGVADKG